MAAFAGAVLGGVGTWVYATKGKLHHPRGVHDWTVSARELHPVLWEELVLVDAPQGGLSSVSGDCDRALHSLHAILACVCMRNVGTVYQVQCAACAETELALAHPILEVSFALCGLWKVLTLDLAVTK